MDLKYNYMLLSRLKQDCEYYLNFGNRNKKVLWAGDEKEQIEKMKELYNSFPKNAKPEWLTYEEILQYEELMMVTSEELFVKIKNLMIMLALDDSEISKDLSITELQKIHNDLNKMLHNEE